MQKSAFARKISAVSIAVFGLYVISGWLVGREAMVLPGSVAVNFNAAFLFFFAAICLAPVSWRPKLPGVPGTSARILILLPCAVLVENILRVDCPHRRALIKARRPYLGAGGADSVSVRNEAKIVSRNGQLEILHAKS